MTSHFARQCQHCHKSQQDIPFKKCGGCRIHWYCSKTCQIESWSVHKAICSKSDSGSRTKGFSKWIERIKSLLISVFERTFQKGDKHLLLTVYADYQDGRHFSVYYVSKTPFEEGFDKNWNQNERDAFALNRVEPEKLSKAKGLIMGTIRIVCEDLVRFFAIVGPPSSEPPSIPIEYLGIALNAYDRQLLTK